MRPMICSIAFGLWSERSRVHSFGAVLATGKILSRDASERYRLACHKGMSCFLFKPGFSECN